MHVTPYARLFSPYSFFFLYKSTGTFPLYSRLGCTSLLPWGFQCYEELRLFLSLQFSHKVLSLSDPSCPYHLSCCVLIFKFLQLSDLILTGLPQEGDAAGQFNREDEGGNSSHGTLPGVPSNLCTHILTRCSYNEQREDDLRSGLNPKLCKRLGKGNSLVLNKPHLMWYKKKHDRQNDLTTTYQSGAGWNCLMKKKRQKFLKHDIHFH